MTAPAKDIVLITGANKGLGFEAALQLGRLGHRVLVGARDEALGGAAVERLSKEGVDATFVAIDVTKNESVEAAAASVAASFGHIDVLINNAGTLNYSLNDPTKLDVDLARKEFEVNFFGVITVTNAFLPLLRKAALPRIVNVSSILASHTTHADPTSTIYGMLVTPYNASKAALNMYTQNLAHALKDTNFKVNVAHPGWVKTDMGGAQAPLEIPEGAETSVYLATLGADGPTGGFFFKKERVPW